MATTCAGVVPLECENETESAKEKVDGGETPDRGESENMPGRNMKVDAEEVPWSLMSESWEVGGDKVIGALRTLSGEVVVRLGGGTLQAGQSPCAE